MPEQQTPLARIELEAVLSRLLARFPRMRLNREVQRLTVDTGTLTRGLVEIPVAW